MTRAKTIFAAKVKKKCIPFHKQLLDLLNLKQQSDNIKFLCETAHVKNIFHMVDVIGLCTTQTAGKGGLIKPFITHIIRILLHAKPPFGYGGDPVRIYRAVEH